MPAVATRDRMMCYHHCETRRKWTALCAVVWYTTSNDARHLPTYTLPSAQSENPGTEAIIQPCDMPFPIRWPYEINQLHWVSTRTALWLGSLPASAPVVEHEMWANFQLDVTHARPKNLWCIQALSDTKGRQYVNYVRSSFHIPADKFWQIDFRVEIYCFIAAALVPPAARRAWYRFSPCRMVIQFYALLYCF